MKKIKINYKYKRMKMNYLKVKNHNFYLNNQKQKKNQKKVLYFNMICLIMKLIL